VPGSGAIAMGRELERMCARQAGWHFWKRGAGGVVQEGGARGEGERGVWLVLAPL